MAFTQSSSSGTSAHSSFDSNLSLDMGEPPVIPMATVNINSGWLPRQNPFVNSQVPGPTSDGAQPSASTQGRFSASGVPIRKAVNSWRNGPSQVNAASNNQGTHQKVPAANASNHVADRYAGMSPEVAAKYFADSKVNPRIPSQPRQAAPAPTPAGYQPRVSFCAVTRQPYPSVVTVQEPRAPVIPAPAVITVQEPRAPFFATPPPRAPVRDFTENAKAPVPTVDPSVQSKADVPVTASPSKLPVGLRDKIKASQAPPTVPVVEQVAVKTADPPLQPPTDDHDTLHHHHVIEPPRIPGFARQTFRIAAAEDYCEPSGDVFNPRYLPRMAKADLKGMFKMGATCWNSKVSRVVFSCGNFEARLDTKEKIWMESTDQKFNELTECAVAVHDLVLYFPSANCRIADAGNWKQFLKDTLYLSISGQVSFNTVNNIISNLSVAEKLTLHKIKLLDDGSLSKIAPFIPRSISFFYYDARTTSSKSMVANVNALYEEYHLKVEGANFSDLILVVSDFPDGATLYELIYQVYAMLKPGKAYASLISSVPLTGDIEKILKTLNFRASHKGYIGNMKEQYELYQFWLCMVNDKEITIGLRLSSVPAVQQGLTPAMV